MLRIFLLIFIPFTVYTQILDRNRAELFIEALLSDNSKLNNYYDENSLNISHRLGIEYDSVAYKFLISYGFDDSNLRDQLLKQKLSYSFTIDSLHDTYSLLKINVEKLKVTKEFYFKGSYCISPLTYLTSDWHVIESKYFRFIISDTNLFNSYCIDELELFTLNTATLLKYQKDDLQILSKNKIYYYLCANDDQIQNLTGFRAKGIYNLAYDAIITTYNTHYHELLHLLINYKIKNVPLYTHPFFQEGFAVATGGRGGLDPKVVLQAGIFLLNSELVNFDELFDKSQFSLRDPSITYPTVGLYNKFLLTTICIEDYLHLYRKYSGSADEIKSSLISQKDLPNFSLWDKFIDNYPHGEIFLLDSYPMGKNIFYKNNNAEVWEDSINYYFCIDSLIAFGNKYQFKNYRSKIWNEILPYEYYNCEEYLVRANENEISVYNLLTNNLIDNYVASFSMQPKVINKIDGRYLFAIKKSVFGPD